MSEQMIQARLRDELRTLRNTFGVTGLGRRFIDNHPEIFGTDAEIERLRAASPASDPSLLRRETVREAWKPTEAQVRSACLSYRHDFGLLSVSEAAIVKSEAREWLHAWQKEGAGADRNEIIEQCAAIVDQANREGPYQAIAAASRIRALSLSPLKD